ncbi:hypothetical protein D0868_16314 [Lecanosticta acicola]|uniref:Uncharacterized protein n=1 Tax=Lecanosticta acicola TaxID=111012 RepID=A0AAI8Z2F5_9PEZI|nr:hypothetical protein D0868_16314 [Lecanosticta acicola]
MGEHAGIPPYARQVLSAASTLKSWLIPVVDQLSQKPDLATIALLLVIVLVSLKILDMLWQTILFWVRMIWKLVFWGGLVALALWMYTRGPDGVAADIQYWQQNWNKEYQYWKEQERVAKLLHQQQGQRRPGGWY